MPSTRSNVYLVGYRGRLVPGTVLRDQFDLDVLRSRYVVLVSFAYSLLIHGFTVTFLWLALLAGTGIANITAHPGIFRAFDPSRAVLRTSRSLESQNVLPIRRYSQFSHVREIMTSSPVFCWP